MPHLYGMWQDGRWWQCGDKGGWKENLPHTVCHLHKVWGLNRGEIFHSRGEINLSEMSGDGGKNALWSNEITDWY